MGSQEGGICNPLYAGYVLFFLVGNSGKTGRKRKVRFEDDEASEPEGIVRRSGRVSKKTKKAQGAKTVL